LRFERAFSLAKACEAAGAPRLLLEAVAGAVGGGRFFEDAGEFAGKVSLVGEAAVVADFGEGMSGADNEVASFLDAEVAEVFLGGHVEAGFEFSQKAAEGEVGIFGEFGDGDVVTVALVEECQSGSEFLVFGEGGGALVEGAGDADDAADGSFLIEEGLFGGGGPVDEAAAAGDELDAVDDGLAGFKDAEVVFADVF